MSLTFVLGGARSGKSAHAQALVEAAAERGGTAPVMIATAEPLDAEMAERIDLHRQSRGPAWRTVEAPLDPAAAIEALQAGEAAVLDCLTLWLSNLMAAGEDIGPAAEILLEALVETPAEVAVVSNEVGLGLVPDNALARRFRDEAGRLHQALAARADKVVLMVAGLPMVVKDAG